MPGQHWVGIYIQRRGGELEFFCSYGQTIRSYDSSFLNFAKRNNLRILENSNSLQSFNSDVCGQFVIFYLFSRFQKCARSVFYAKFSKVDTVKNDKIVRRFVYQKLLAMKLKCNKINHNQCCNKRI